MVTTAFSLGNTRDTKKIPALSCVTAVSLENKARSRGKGCTAYLLSFWQAPPHKGTYRGLVLCQGENLFKAEAAGTEAQEGRAGPPRPAPRCRLRPRPGPGGERRSRTAPPPRRPGPARRAPSRAVRGGQGRGAARRPPAGGRDQPQDGGGAEPGLGTRAAGGTLSAGGWQGGCGAACPHRVLTPRASPTLGSRIPCWERNKPPPPSASTRGSPSCRLPPALSRARRGAASPRGAGGLGRASARTRGQNTGPRLQQRPDRGSGTFICGRQGRRASPARADSGTSAGPARSRLPALGSAFKPLERLETNGPACHMASLPPGRSDCQWFLQ